MRKLLLILIALFSLSKLNAQIEDEIKSFVDTTNLIVNNGRSLLEKSALNGDYQKMSDVYNYLKEVTTDSKMDPFFITEEIYINFLLKEWENVANLMAKYTKEYKFTPIQGMEPISETLYDELVRNYSDLKLALENSDITARDKNFLQMLLYLLKADKADEVYREMYRKYEKEYSETVYENALKYFMGKPLGRLSYSIYLGPSFGFPISGGNKYGSMFGGYMGFDINIHRTYFSLYLAAGSLESGGNYTVEKDGVQYAFDNNDHFTYFQGGASLGYFIKRNDNFHLAPYLTFLSVQIDTDKFNPDDSKPEDNLTVMNTFGFGPGIHSEINLFTFEPGQGRYYYPISSYISLKLDVCYTYPIETAIKGMESNFLMAKVGLVWGFGEF